MIQGGMLPAGFPYTIPFWGQFTASTPTIPQFYWDVYSSEQRWKFICVNLKKLIEYSNMLGVNLGITNDAILALTDQFEQFKDGAFLDFYMQQIEKWINDNMQDIISKAIKFVFFGLTKDGYFTAYIPQSWAGIAFDTVMDYENKNYGSLCLYY